MARTSVGDRERGANRDASTAVVFGGHSIVLGSLLAAVIVGVFRNGLTPMGPPSVYLVLITGILVILAVTTDQLSRKGARVMSAASTNTAPLVMQAKAVVKRYRQVTALDSCDFEPHAGKITSVIGDNGAGKSSLMNARREGPETVYQGPPMILVSHNMPHVFEIADRIHIARLRKRVCIVNPKRISMSDRVAVMTGAKQADELRADAAA